VAERSAEELDNARAQRDRSRAAYVSKLHLLRADAYAANHRVAEAHAEIVALEHDLEQLAARAGELLETAWRDGAITTGECLTLLRQRCADERRLLDQRGEYLLRASISTSPPGG